MLRYLAQAQPSTASSSWASHYERGTRRLLAKNSLSFLHSGAVATDRKRQAVELPFLRPLMHALMK